MIKFNMSEEIIFSIKTGIIDDNLFKDSFALDTFIDRLLEKSVLIIYGLSNIIREKVCFKVVREFLNNKYQNFNDINVFKVNYLDELDEIYTGDKFQIFYLDDFLGRIRFDLTRFENYVHKFMNSKNKLLIVSIREFSLPQDFLMRFNDICEDIYCFTNDFVGGDCEKFNSGYEKLEAVYSRLFYLDKFVVFSVLTGGINDFDLWIKIIKNYFLSKRILRENTDFSDLVIDSFRKLEEEFIYIKDDGKFYIKDIAVEEFLLSKIKMEYYIIKDLISNIYSFEVLGRFVLMLKDLRVKLNYNYGEYESNLKNRLFELICLSNSKNLINVLSIALDIFDILGVVDFDIINDLNSRIVYLSIDIDIGLEYICRVRNFREILIRDQIFEDKFRDVIHQYSPHRNVEFYSYSLKYFLLASEFYGLYSDLDLEDIIDIRANFFRLVDLILNNINSYFTLEYFSLSMDVKCVLIDIKDIVYKFNIKFIFSKNMERIFIDITYRFNDLLNTAIDLDVTSEKDYYMLKYFVDELDRNKDFLEFVFDDLNLEGVVNEIKKNICKFQA